MFNNRPFNIVTLSDEVKQMDPVTIITAGTALLGSLFPNLFGQNRKLLTTNDWIQLIPGSGYWTQKLRTFLAARIKYDVDLGNMQALTIDFVFENRSLICPDVPVSSQCWNNPGTGLYVGQGSCPECMTKFYAILKQETQTGGMSPVGQTPGGIGQTVNLNALIPLAIAGVVLVAALKTKKRPKRK
jgi:hypothetical protein